MSKNQRKIKLAWNLLLFLFLELFVLDQPTSQNGGEKVKKGHSADDVAIIIFFIKEGWRACVEVSYKALINEHV